MMEIEIFMVWVKDLLMKLNNSSQQESSREFMFLVGKQSRCWILYSSVVTARSLSIILIAVKTFRNSAAARGVNLKRISATH